jgi:hypothetical protein
MYDAYIQHGEADPGTNDYSISGEGLKDLSGHAVGKQARYHDMG